MLQQVPVLFICYSPEPCGVALPGIRHYRNMGETAVRCGTMPVFSRGEESLLCPLPGSPVPSYPLPDNILSAGNEQDLSAG